MAASGRHLSRLREWPFTASCLDGVIAAVTALLVAVALQMGVAGIVDLPIAGIGLLAWALLTVARINPAWCLAAGAVAGWGALARF